MSGKVDNGITPPAEPVGSAFDREKWLAENAFRDRELALKEREQERLDDELRFKREEARRSRWSSPLVIAVLGAAAAGLGNAAVAWQSAKAQRTLENDRALAAQKAQEFNNQSQLILEEFKAEAARLFEVVKTNDPDKAAVNLQFLLDIGLITNPETKKGLTNYLKNRKEGQGFALPTAAAPPAFSREDFSPLFSVKKTALPAGFSPQDEVAYMVRLLQRSIAPHGKTIAMALPGYATDPNYAPRIVLIMRQHGYPDVTEDSNIDLNNRAFLKALLWSIGRLESRADIPDAVLDSGIDTELKLKRKVHSSSMPSRRKHCANVLTFETAPPRVPLNARPPSALSQIWLPFLDTYRTMCLVPQPEFRRVLEEIREIRLAV